MCPGSIPASLTGASRSDAILRSTCGEQLVYLRLGVPVHSSLEQVTFLNRRGGRNPSERGMFAMGGLRFMHAFIYFSMCLRCTEARQLSQGSQLRTSPPSPVCLPLACPPGPVLVGVPPPSGCCLATCVLRPMLAFSPPLEKMAEMEERVCV